VFHSRETRHARFSDGGAKVETVPAPDAQFAGPGRCDLDGLPGEDVRPPLRELE
jgi:hypothetical protein